ncbi:hypothetical protein K402DRAFT_452894 [Aulographum hederae CBS 113979]|uniref:Vps41 beta-propeller domain-containing protein n=1 Tax=Aulographum hederae CBS 113979 TaxID=1176131 RepID=A0A6G1H4T5_9PEZI|nr:hypothetical protein K402DRAFT_452894 [Aulographum hederae CBS 113979]
MPPELGKAAEDVPPKLEKEADSDDDEDEDDGDDEPKLKYTRLTGQLGSVYRNGDATSSFTVAGDKMVIGTHNGNIHVISIPTFQTVRYYHAHSASITAVSVSPFSPPLPTLKSEAAARVMATNSSPSKSPSTTSKATSSPRTPRQPPVPATPSNSIYIATSSIDGNVCVSSLVDPNDVLLRNFARPVQSVALSPEYKNDRTYLSGGLAGNLILTVGGKTGISQNANTNSAAAAASGWLGSMGLGSSTGSDKVLHSGEGSISTIKWSLSGKFVVWVNEKGIKIMRSNLKLESVDAESAWKRIGHIDVPNRRAWEDMASVWKARADWIDETHLESDEHDHAATNGSATTESGKGPETPVKNSKKKRSIKYEKLVVGWGDTTWVLHVKPESAGTGKNAGERVSGSADIIHKLVFDDCIISGLSLYTPSLLLILAYRTRDDDNNPISSSVETTPRRGRQHRQNGLSPELRLVDVSTAAEVDVDTLTMSRFESLSIADYHLGTLYVPPVPTAGPISRGALEAFSSSLWDVGASAGRMFGSGASVRSQGSGDNTIASAGAGSIGTSHTAAIGRRTADTVQGAATAGLKVFIQSPYDCVLAVKRDLGDHFEFLMGQKRYREAWDLLNNHPEVIASSSERLSGSESPSSPSKSRQSLAEFFADDSASQTTTSAPNKAFHSAVEKEKRRIGDLLVEQLVNAKDWQAAGKAAGRVLGTSSRWEHWVWTFAEASRFDEIAPYIPTKQLHPPLPSLVYEVVLGHYISHDCLRLKELLDDWDPELFDVNSVASAIESKLKSGDVSDETSEDGVKGRDWRILLDCLAKLYIADSRPKEALRCYIRLQNADAAMELIREYQLLGAISDDVPGFVLLRVSKEQMRSAPLKELEEASSEAVRLLVDEAYQGIVMPSTVVGQLRHRGPEFQPFLFFYLRALWRGDGFKTKADKGLKGTERHIAEGRSFVEDFGDLAIELFAEYDRELLMQLLKVSERYDYDKACRVCETREYIPELVFLLSKTGQMKRALFLIIDRLGDVSRAIEFAKNADDEGLWNDLLDYSMDKPKFIRGLLNEIGTAIDPITLVRRIPEGLEIEGLRDGIGRMVREFEIQDSISEGVARVLRGEVAMGLDVLRAGQRRGVKFEVVKEDEKKDEVELFVDQVPVRVDEEQPPELAAALPRKQPLADDDLEPGHCVGCGEVFAEHEKEPLLGFACGHVYHLSCLLDRITSPSPSSSSPPPPPHILSAAERLRAQLERNAGAGESYSDSRSVGAKVAHAHVIRSVVRGGCPVCRGAVVDGEEGAG